MACISANGIDIEYESFGDPAGEPLLLIMGLGTQLIGWPDDFCEALAGYGYHVIRFDNRDIGLSTRLDHERTPNIPMIVGLRALKLPVPVPYRLTDMAEDTVGLLDALGIERAHLVGASMGGMIAQIVAARFPERTRSLTSIMSTTGNRSLPRAEPQAARALMLKPEDPADPESIIERSVRVREAVQSPAYPKDRQTLYEAAARAYHRGGYYPSGVARQLAAAILSADRRQLLKRVTAPSLVIHGEADPLVRVECGLDTARHLPDCEVALYPGMGHDFPDPLLMPMAEEIHRNASRA